MAKLAIKINETDFNKPHFTFFCINTTLNDYHFCWALNEMLSLNFARIENISLNETSSQSFSVFQDRNTNPELIYSLLSIKSDNGLLMKDLAGFDFLLCVDGQIDTTKVKQMQSTISTIKNVLLITRLENKKTKPSTIADLSYLMEMIG